jgi:hypothetical protein
LRLPAPVPRVLGGDGRAPTAFDPEEAGGVVEEKSFDPDADGGLASEKSFDPDAEGSGGALSEKSFDPDSMSVGGTRGPGDCSDSDKSFDASDESFDPDDVPADDASLASYDPDRAGGVRAEKSFDPDLGADDEQDLSGFETGGAARGSPSKGGTISAEVADRSMAVLAAQSREEVQRLQREIEALKRANLGLKGVVQETSDRAERKIVQLTVPGPARRALHAIPARQAAAEGGGDGCRRRRGARATSRRSWRG